MNLSIRRVIEMAGRVRDFCRTHPYENPGYTAAVDQLHELLSRAQALAEQQLSGQLSVTGAVGTAKDQRDEIRHSIELLAGLARAASVEDPELRAGITRLPFSGSQRELVSRARVASGTARARQQLLAKYGLPDNLLDQLDAALDSFESAITEKNAGRVAHVGARADLSVVGAELLNKVRQLDALNRYRYRKDSESLAAWLSARNVAWPLRSRETPPGTDSEKPAA